MVELCALDDGFVTTAQLAELADFTLGRARISPSTRTVSGPGGAVSLEPRVMQLLVVLGQAAGHVVTRDMLFRRCWGLSNIGDASLNRVVSCARRAAEQVAPNSLRIETVPRTGYLLREVPAGPSGQDGPVSDKGAGIAGLAGSSLDRRAAIAGGAALCLSGAGAAGWLLTRSRRDAEVEHIMQQAQDAVHEGMPDDMARAAALYRLVIDKEPDNAAAWAGLSGVYRFDWEFGSREEAAALQARARSAARRALEIDPDNGAALATLAGLVPMFGSWAAAETAMRRVYARHPREIGIRLARLLHDTGRIKDALELARSGAEREQEVPRYRNFHAKLLWDIGRVEEAEQMLGAALARWPRHLLLWFTRFWLLAYSGRPRAALAFVGEVSSRPIGVPDRVFELAERSATALASGAHAAVDDAVARHVAALRDGAAYAENAATFCAAVGRVDEAFGVLDAYYFGRGARVADARFGPETATYTPTYNRQCAFLFARPTARLRSDPRFAALTREIGLDAYWRTAGRLPDYRLT